MSDLLSQDEKGIWLSIKELADRDGVARQTMHRKVRRLENDGHLKTRTKGRSVLVDVAKFDFAVEKFGNERAEQSAQTKATSGAIDEDLALREAQRRKAEYDSELTKLKLDREKGLVRPVSEIEDAGVLAATEILRALEELPSMADEICRASGGTDIKKGRAIAKKLVDEIRQKLVDTLGVVPEGSVKSKGKRSSKQVGSEFRANA